MDIVERELLEAEAQAAPSFKSGSHREQNGSGGKFDVAAWIKEHEVPVRREGDWGNGGYRWVLEECPWNGHMDNSAFIVKRPNGAIGAGCHHNSCQGYRWRDLREHYEPGAYSDSSEAATTQIPVPAFPVEALPPVLKEFVEEASSCVVCPPDFVALPMLAMLGAAIGNARNIRVKKGWTESPTIYGAVVADPGTKKSPAFSIAVGPAWRRQDEYQREYEEAMAEYNKRIEEEEDEGEEPPREPTLRRVVYGDSTVEALFDKLEENPRGIMCNKDELSSLVLGFNQYKGGKGSDKQIYLSMWSNSPLIVDRKSRKNPLMVSRPFVALAGTIQPDFLSEIKSNRDDGLLDRFLLAYPDSLPSPWSDDELSDKTLADYQKLYQQLCDLDMPVDDNGRPAPKELQLESKAREFFVSKVNSLREEMDLPLFPRYLKGPWSKLEAYLARLTLITALVRIVREEGSFFRAFETIYEEDVEAAAELIEYFKAHARRAYTEFHGKAPEYLLAEFTVRFLRERGEAWEEQTAKIYDLFKSLSAPGLPGGAIPFGKLLRKVCEKDPRLILEESWRGSTAVVKLRLSTPGTPGGEEELDAEGLEAGGTGGKDKV